MMRACLVSLALSLGMAGPGGAEALYLGTEEFDTGDRATMEAIIEHCREVSREAGDGASNGAGLLGQGVESERAGQASGSPVGSVGTGIGTDQLASGDGDGESSGDADPDLSGISAELCSEAGIIY